MRGRQNIRSILPRLRKIACEIKRLHGIDMLAIGKESMPIRVAELTACAEAIVFEARGAVDEKETIVLRLPLKCQPRFLDSRVYLHSLIANEHDIRGFSIDSGRILTKVKLSETLNPFAKGFRALKITPAS